MDIEKFTLNETSYFGEGARKVLPEEIKKRGFKKVLVVTDESLYKAGVSTKITDLLEANNINYVLFHDVKPNPPIKNVLDGVAMCKEEKCDLRQQILCQWSSFLLIGGTWTWLSGQYQR